jgi:hypothetical protein
MIAAGVASHLKQIHSKAVDKNQSIRIYFQVRPADTYFLS